MNNDPKASPFDITALAVGAVRISLESLQPEEVGTGALVRDLDPVTARRVAIELLQACEEAERLRATLEEDSRP